PERLGEAGEAVGAEGQRLERAIVRLVQRPGRVGLARPFGRELLLLGEVPELLLQLGGLDPLGRERVAELTAHTLGVVADRLHARHVAAVSVALLVLLAALHPEEEQDDDQDREGDQAEQPQQRREAGARANRALRHSWPAPAAQWAPQGTVAPPRALLRLRLLEEVELEVGV